MKRHQNGFSPAVVILALCLISLAAFVFWRVRQADKTSQEAAINSFADCVAAGNPVMESYPEQCAAGGKTFTNPNQAETNNSIEESANIFKIPELGVQFDLPTELSNLYYQTEADNPRIAYFSLEEFKGTACAADQTSQAALSKLTEEEVDADEMIKNSKDSLKQIDGAYYLAVGAQAMCSEDEAVQAKASSVRSGVLNAVRESLTKIQ